MSLPSVGFKIKKIRKHRGMTQKELGLAIGFDKKGADSRVAQYETGYRVPQKKTLDKIAAALTVPPEIMCSKDGSAETFVRDVFWMEEKDPSVVQTCLLMCAYLKAWESQRVKLAAGLITQEEYFDWKLNFKGANV